MPIKRTKAPAKPRRKSAAAGAEPVEAVVSQDEKHRLIMAHAAMRPTRDPVQFMSMWAGVLVAVIAVVMGWWWSVGSGLASSYAGGGIAETVRSLAPDPEVPKSAIEQDLEDVAKRLQQLHDKAAAQQEALEAQQAQATTSSGNFALPPDGADRATSTSSTTIE